MAKISWFAVALAATIGAAPAAAQGQGHAREKSHAPAKGEAPAPEHAEDKGHTKKGYVVSSNRAVTVTRTVLERQGYDVVRVERVGATQVVYYRRGNNGRGKGRGPLEKLVIRTVRDRILFEEAPPAILVDIDIKLR